MVIDHFEWVSNDSVDEALKEIAESIKKMLVYYNGGGLQQAVTGKEMGEALEIIEKYRNEINTALGNFYNMCPKGEINKIQSIFLGELTRYINQDGVKWNGFTF